MTIKAMHLPLNLLVGAVLSLPLSGLATAALARDLTVVSWGGPYQDAQRKFMFGPFIEESGIKLTDTYWEGGVGALRTKVRGGNNDWDVVQVESEELGIGCDEGLFEHFDVGRSGGPDRFLPGMVNDCGVAAVIYNLVLAYDNAKQGTKPENWAAFFDTKAFPGKRAVRNGPKWNLEIALLADGVPADQVYKVLSTPEGVDRAFAMYDKIKDSLIFWKTGAQPVQMLASGDVVMTTAFNSRITASNEQNGSNFGIVWRDSIYTKDSWVIMKGTPKLDESYKFLEFATRAAPQAALPEFNRSGPSNKDAPGLIDAKYLHDLPSNPDNFKVAVPEDPSFWIDNFDDLNDRWNRWAGTN